MLNSKTEIAQWPKFSSSKYIFLMTSLNFNGLCKYKRALGRRVCPQRVVRILFKRNVRNQLSFLIINIFGHSSYTSGQKPPLTSVILLRHVVFIHAFPAVFLSAILPIWLSQLHFSLARWISIRCLCRSLPDSINVFEAHVEIYGKQKRGK